MRVIIKGGVWKNTEDEVLKAAVMKYGKNQWARISSLLNRKTPKQCKARWYEWLDPSIKKTEWSKEEDEKLLHLAKLMPTQWRTIAPIVGRTPAQCLERYQRLLDDAERKEAGEEAGPSGEDIRRLRPGEIDPDPETKPAKPDPVDMDEDEKEMLSEARARLANTQGKKAKRKARERQLEEARRLSFIQKRRELKASGVELKFRPGRKQFNWNMEIPFEIKPTPGFFDTTDEKNREVKLDFRGKLVSDFDLKRNGDMEKETLKKEEKRRKENAAKGISHSMPPPDPELFMSKRRKLTMPAPQIGESELEELVKLGHSGELARAAVEESDHISSRGLVSDYGASIQQRIADRAAAIQATRTPAIVDSIQTEAANLLALQKMETPLLGGENAHLREGGTGFEGLTPQRHMAATPAAPSLAGTPARAGVGETPRTKFGFTPARTPLRDNLHLNKLEDDVSHMGDDVMDASDMEKYRLERIRAELVRAFAALPKPKNDFEIAMPEVEDEMMAEDEDRDFLNGDEDVGEMEIRRRKQLLAAEESRLAMRSQVLKRNLPRPWGLMQLQVYKDDTDPPLDDVQEMVLEEMSRLMNGEAYEYPPNGFPPSQLQRPEYVEDLDEKMLDEARALIQRELEEIKGSLPDGKEAILTDGEDWLLKKDGDSFRSVFVGSLKKGEKKQALLANAIAQFELAADAMGILSSKCNHLHKNLQAELGTQLSRAQVLKNQIEKAYQERVDLDQELRIFEGMQIRERDVGIPMRLEALEREVKVVRKRERAGQERYRELLLEAQKRAPSIANGH